MPRTSSVAAFLAIAAAATGAVVAAGALGEVAPPFTHTDAAAWVNSPPLTLESLRGKVVLLDVWTFGCWNCTGSIPWLLATEKRFGAEGLRVVGVHAPEFDAEKGRARVAAKAAELHLTHPIMVDDDHSYWNALGNRYWPAFYLVDQAGRLRGKWFGETHAGDDQARAIERAITALLARR
jgi:hypothetical protein